MGKKYYEEIDILKGIAIAMVILGHAIIRFPINLHEVAWTNALYDWVETTHMPLFFMVSGFCFSYRGKYGEYIIKKIKRILIPFLLFNLIDCVPRSILPSLVNRPKPISESILDIVLYGGEYWFLYALFLIFLFFPALSGIMKNKTVQVVVVALCVVLKFVPVLPEMFLIKRTCYHLLYFVIGYVLKQYFSIEGSIKVIESKKAAFGIAIIGLSCIWVAVIPFYVVEHVQYLGIPLAFIGITWSYLITVLVLKGRVRKLFAGFGKYSLQLYLLNGFTLVASRTFTIKILHCSIPAVIVAINMAVDLFVSYLIIKYILARFKVTKLACGIV
ncbi:MAG: acyltransferase [Ruminococcus sp.]|nr:acyltransferase [Ruminococcus sp.]